MGWLKCSHNHIHTRLKMGVAAWWDILVSTHNRCVGTEGGFSNFVPIRIKRGHVCSFVVVVVSLICVGETDVR